MKRRTFLAGAAGLVAFAVIARPLRALPTIPSRPAAEAEDAESWIAYRDGRYVLSVPRAEIGQNIATALKQIVCAELGVAWNKVDVLHADTSSIAPYRATVSSESIQDFALPLAQACASLRDAVAAGKSGRAAVTERPIGELWAFKKGRLGLSEALEGVEAIVTGQPLFAADIRLPDMVYGRVLRAPVSLELDSRPDAFNRSAAAAEAGFVAIVEGDGLELNNSLGLGIVAETPGALDRIEAALAVSWVMDELPSDDAVTRSLDIDNRGAPRYEVQNDEVDPSDPWDVDLRIDTPLAAHATIEPRAAVADIAGDGGRVWIGSQDPFYVRDAIAKELNLDSDNVVIVPQRVGGAFGGKAVPTVEIEAAALSKAAGRPVKVQWTRAQEFAQAYHRQATSHRVKARVRDGRVTDWSHQMASGHSIFSNAVLPSWMQTFTDFIGDSGAARNIDPPYDIARKFIGYDLERLPIRTGAWRGLGAGPNTLAVEMAMEAAARQADTDPVDFRLKHITDSRLRATLAKVRDIAGSHPGKGFGRGVGCGIYKGVSYGAVIADVGIKPDGTPYVARLFCAHDCGLIVNRDLVRAQCEGNLVWSIGMVLSDRLSMVQGQVAEVDFLDAPIPQISDVPPMEISLIETDHKPTGAGETLMASAPGAIVNAFTDLTGKAPKELPLSNGLAWPRQ